MNFVLHKLLMQPNTHPSKPSEASVTHRRDSCKRAAVCLEMKNCTQRLFQSNLSFKLLPSLRRERIESEKLAGFLEAPWPKISVFNRTRSASRGLYALLLISYHRFQSRLCSLINLWRVVLWNTTPTFNELI